MALRPFAGSERKKSVFSGIDRVRERLYMNGYRQRPGVRISDFAFSWAPLFCRRCVSMFEGCEFRGIFGSEYVNSCQAEFWLLPQPLGNSVSGMSSRLRRSVVHWVLFEWNNARTRFSSQTLRFPFLPLVLILDAATSAGDFWSRTTTASV